MSDHAKGFIGAAIGAILFAALYWLFIGYIAADFNWPGNSLAWTAWDAGAKRAMIAIFFIIAEVVGFFVGGLIGSEV